MSKTIKIIPVTFSWQVPAHTEESIIFVLESFNKGLQESGIDIYERVPFTIEKTDDPRWSKIRGRYGFNGATNNQKGSWNEIKSSYIELELKNV